MKEKIVQLRSLVACFVGGFIGIITAGYVDPLLLPFGCFIGVVIGWGYQRIWNTFKTECIKTKFSFLKSVDDAVNIFRTLKQLYSKQHLRGLLTSLKSLIDDSAKLITRLFRRSKAIARLIRKTKSLQEKIVQFSAIGLFGFVGMAIFIFLTIKLALFEPFKPGHVLEFFKVCKLISISFGFLMWIMPILIRSTSNPDDNLLSFTQIRQRVDSSKVKLFFSTLWYLLIGEILVCTLISTALIVGILGIISFTLYVLVPVYFIIGFMKALHKTITKGGYWLCYGVTSAVTIFTVWITNIYLEDARVLWTIALLNGFASAGATELIRRFIYVSYSGNKNVMRMVHGKYRSYIKIRTRRLSGCLEKVFVPPIKVIFTKFA